MDKIGHGIKRSDPRGVERAPSRSGNPLGFDGVLYRIMICQMDKRSTVLGELEWRNVFPLKSAIAPLNIIKLAPIIQLGEVGINYLVHS